MKSYDIVILGAGTAGLSARKEVAKKTDNYLVVDPGPLGTTCARVGCMPSKVLIQVAADYERRKKFLEIGISGTDGLSIDHATVLEHVRSLRDRFVRSVFHGMESWQKTHFVPRQATFIDQNTLDLEGEKITAKKIIIATGSSPVVPETWNSVGADFLLDTDRFFESETLPNSMIVIGLGVIGLEIGQALQRLGVNIVAIGRDKGLGGLTDPEIHDYAFRRLSKEMQIDIDGVDQVKTADGMLVVSTAKKTYTAEKALVAIGRKPNIDRLNLDSIGIPRDKHGIPEFEPGTYRILGTDIYLVGDVLNERPILHEAADEGRIAGFNAARNESQCFRRRTFLAITFSDPNIAIAGQSYAQLKDEGVDFVSGQVSYEGQGRAIIKRKETGLINIYAHRKTGILLGAELFAPEGEHLAHLISWCIASKMNVFDALSLPFYHPVLEEGLRTALRSLTKKVENTPPHLELLRCQDPPAGTWE